MRTIFGLMGGLVLIGAAFTLTSIQAFSQIPAAPAQATQPIPARPPAAAPAAVKPEELPIRATLTALVRAFAAGDVQNLVALFSDNAIVVDTTGTEARGKQAIADLYGSSFQQTPGLKLEAELNEIQFLAPNVARAEGRSRISSPNGDASEYTKFSTLLTGANGKWSVAEIREYPLPPEDVPTGERLKELEWMVGNWVDESGENKVSSNVRWADNKSYLIRTYQVDIKNEKTSSGTMFIGWDPQNGQIKSWIFDSEGGHGEGLWTRTDENTWVVKSSGVLRDGRPTSATQIHTLVNKDAAKTSSIDRIIGGQLAPDILDIVMVRKPPKPDAVTPQPAASPR